MKGRDLGLLALVILAISAPAIGENVAGLARDSQRLDGVSAESYVKKCGDGSVVGVGRVYQGTDAYEEVPGYVFGPRSDGSGCKKRAPLARREDVGVYFVRFSRTSCTDEPMPPDPVTVSVADSSAERVLIANFRTVCDGGQVTEEIRINDSLGTPQDSEFVVVLHDLS